MTEESKIPKSFDEIDNDSGDAPVVIRTLFDFELLDKNGNLVPLEAIGEGKRGVRCVAKIIQPLEEAWKDKCLLYTSAADTRETVDQLVDECVQLYKKAQPHHPGEGGGEKDRDRGHSKAAAPVKTGLAAVRKNALSYLGIKGVSTFAPELDRASIKEGTSLDGYCVKTFKWYSAKVVKMRTDKSGITQASVHFQGWQSRYDEWIDINSDRLVADGASAIMMREQATHLKEMVPWFEPERLMAKVEQVIGPPKERKTLDVIIDNIEDWAMDFSFTNPAIWLISKTGVWYRIANPMTPGGVWGNPTERYAPLFKPVARKFIICAHVAMVLLEFFPSLPKMTVDQVCNEVSERTRMLTNAEDRVRESDILTNYALVVEKISSISHPPDWEGGPKLPAFENSVFISTLKKTAPAYIQATRKLAMAYQQSATMGMMGMGMGMGMGGYGAMGGMGGGFDGGGYGASSMGGGPGSQFGFPPNMYGGGGGGGSGFEAGVDEFSSEPAAKKKRKSGGAAGDSGAGGGLRLSIGGGGGGGGGSGDGSKSSMPRLLLEDKEYWEQERRRRLELNPSLGHWEPPPAPLPIGGRVSRQLNYDPRTAGALLSSWGALLHFRHPLALPHVALEEFEAMLFPSFAGVHPVLRELLITLLAKLLMARGRQPLKLCPDPFTASKQGTHNDARLAAHVHAFGALDFEFLLPKRLATNDPEASKVMPPEERVREFLRTGDAWVEVLRVLVAEHHKVVLGEYHDPLGLCLDVVTQMMQMPDARLFCMPVDPVIHGMPDYPFYIREPMDLSTVRSRLLSGWYEAPLPSSSAECLRAVAAPLSAAGQVGQGLLTPPVFTPSAASLGAHLPPPAAPQALAPSADMTIKEGDERDIWSAAAQRWVLGSCVAVDKASRSVTFRAKHRGQTLEERVPWDGSYITTRYCFTRYPLTSKEQCDLALARRCKPPNEFRAAPADENARINPEATKGCGYLGVLRDMRIVFANCLKYFRSPDGSETGIAPTAQRLSLVFEELFSLRVTNIVSGQSFPPGGVVPGTDPEAASRWQQAVDALASSTDLGSAPFETKVRVVSFVWDELLSSSFGRKLLDDAVEVARFFEMQVRPPRKTGDKNEDRQPKSLQPVPSSVSLTMQNCLGRKGYRRISNEDGRSEASSLPPERLAVMRQRAIRLTPLGRGDRHDRNYWVFTSEHPECEAGDLPRVFVEDTRNGRWFIYAVAEELSSLYWWMDPNARREARTREALAEWMNVHGVPLLARPKGMAGEVNYSVGTGDSASDVADHALIQPTPEQEALLKERADRHAARLAPQWRDPSVGIDCNYRLDCWMSLETQPTALLLKVRLGFANQALGMAVRDLVLSASGFNIVVTGYNPSADGRSAIKEAGVRIGDRIAAIGSQVTRCIADIKLGMREPVEEIKRRGQGGADLELDFLVLRYPDAFSELTERESQDPVYRTAIAEYDAELAVISPGVEIVTDGGGDEAAAAAAVATNGGNSVAGAAAGAPGGLRRKRQRRCVPGWAPSRTEFPGATHCSTPHPQLEQAAGSGVLPSRLVGQTLQILHMTAHPYIAVPEWSAEVDLWVAQIASRLSALLGAMQAQALAAVTAVHTQNMMQHHNNMHGGSSSSSSSSSSLGLDGQVKVARVCLLRVLSAALLRLDTSLCSVATKGIWLDNASRQRFKWRQCVKNAASIGQLSVPVGMLWAVLRVEPFCRLESRQLDRKLQGEVITNNIYFRRHAALHEGAHVVYFAEGHAEAEDKEKTIKAPRMWGGSLSSGEEARSAPWAGKVLECRVTGVRLFKCGTRTESMKKSYPFAQVDLLVLPATLSTSSTTSFTLPEVGPKLQPHAALNHIIGQIVFDISQLPEANSLYTGPHKSLMPEYAREVGVPEPNLVFFKDIRAKVRERRYNSVAELSSDVEQCCKAQKTYNVTRNTIIVQHADVVWAEFQLVLNKLRAQDIARVESEANLLDPEAGAIVSRKQADFLRSEEAAKQAAASAAANAAGAGAGAGAGVVVGAAVPVKRKADEMSGSAAAPSEATTTAAAAAAGAAGAAAIGGGSAAGSGSEFKRDEKLPEGTAKAGIPISKVSNISPLQYRKASLEKMLSTLLYLMQ